jgi:SET domain-containing protein
MRIRGRGADYAALVPSEINPPKSIRVEETPLGRGVIASAPIAAGETIEVCPVLAIDAADADGVLTDYVVDPGDDSDGAVLMLGYGSLYNHSEDPNAEYVWVTEDVYEFTALRDIAAGEEITISYSEEWWTTREREPD